MDCAIVYSLIDVILLDCFVEYLSKMLDIYGLLNTIFYKMQYFSTSFCIVFLFPPLNTAFELIVL